MKGETKSAGFTIVETLIVLAVTGFLFVSIMITLNGQVGRAQFQQSVRDIQTKVQQTINEVSAGFFPSNSDFACSKGIDPYNLAKQAPHIGAGATEQGKNSDCMFMGKVIQFSATNPPTDPEQFNTYTLAGLREATSFDATRVVTIDMPGVVKKNDLAYGLTVVSVKYRQGGVDYATNSVGFIPTVGDLADANTYEAGRVDMVVLPGTNVSTNETDTKTAINSTHLIGAPMNPDGGVTVCFKSGTTKDTALLTIGSNGHNLAVKVEIKACS